LIHLSPSNLNSWQELSTANEESPVWVTKESFKDSIMGVFKTSVKASAGNACSIYLFGGPKTHEENGWKFSVDDKILSLRDFFPFGTGIPEVPRVRELDGELFDGEQVRLSMRTDYLCPNIIGELKTSSHSFEKKGKTRSYLESMQAFTYMDTYCLPIMFLFSEIGIKEDENGVNVITVKKNGHAIAYPCANSGDRLRNCIRTLVPYLKSDDQLWERVTHRADVDYF
jgi:hypothetical protein